jgi:hypothetical protein
MLTPLCNGCQPRAPYAQNVVDAQPLMDEKMKVDKIHHAAFRCKYANQTVEWYGEMLSNKASGYDGDFAIT